MPDPHDFDDANLIEAICDECEQRLKAGEEVDLLDLAKRCEPHLWGRLVPEILLIDIDHAREAGRRPNRDEYRQRYPDFRHHIEAVAATLSLEDAAGERAVRAGPHVSPGQVFSHFELVRELGSGASGVVWEAVDLGTTRRVAIKVPRWNELSVDERLRFFREGRAASRLDHTGIAKLFEVNTFEGCPYLASELVEGETFREVLKSGPMAPEAAARLCLSVAEALHHAHQQGVIHRDVKPANLLIHPDGRPCLTDFGLAKCRDDDAALTEHGDILGSPAYMAPEQARGRTRDAGPATDLYALGVVLFEALTGQTPFTGDRVTILRDVIDEGIEAPSPKRFRSELPPDLAAICRMALQKRPTDRYSNAEELVSDLGRYLRGETVQARRPPAAVRLFRWGSRRKRLIALVLMAVTTTLGASAFLSYVLTPDSRRQAEIQTVPAGARVAFVPMSEGSKQPAVKDAVFGKGAGPIRAKLQPGDYLVVAVTGDGRFHEVYRTVPALGEEPDVAGPYQYVQNGPGGIALLNPIKIPPRAITESMVRVEGAQGFPLGYTGSSGFDGMKVDLPAFYMDPTEFCLEDHLRCYPQRANDRARFGRAEASPETGWACSYFEAINAAEAAGKRLPTEAEYEFVATACGTSRYPWGNDFPTSIEAKDFGAVASVPFDRFEEGDGVIYGLCSNLAEWVIPFGPFDPARPADYGVARGGDSATLRGGARVSASSRDPMSREYLGKRELIPGVGFRGVRSSAPLFTYEAIH